MKTDIAQLFHQHVLEGENLLWTGKPESKCPFTALDIFLIPISLVFGGIPIIALSFLISTAIYSYLHSSSDQFSLYVYIIFSIFLIPFVLYSLYFIIGRYIYKIWRNNNTYYAVTDRRLIKLTKFRYYKFKDYDINSIKGSELLQGSGDTGHVIWDTMTPPSTIYLLFFSRLYLLRGLIRNTGLDYWSGYAGEIEFYDIRKPKKVYELVEQLRSALKSSGSSNG